MPACLLLSVYSGMAAWFRLSACSYICTIALCDQKRRFLSYYVCVPVCLSKLAIRVFSVPVCPFRFICLRASICICHLMRVYLSVCLSMNTIGVIFHTCLCLIEICSVSQTSSDPSFLLHLRLSLCMSPSSYTRPSCQCKKIHGLSLLSTLLSSPSLIPSGYASFLPSNLILSSSISLSFPFFDFPLSLSFILLTFLHLTHLLYLSFLNPSFLYLTLPLSLSFLPSFLSFLYLVSRSLSSLYSFQIFQVHYYSETIQTTALILCGG